ncbi:unnamed protein product [Caenorhabditis auriculariae]|uniref:Rieske domain-containing protein n=1 Tax=Caenorhabditis auriculariae TaxID=2777116 RepID=A0A8S1GU18_9PELO|nr:unnamed protein product [Caenorhabditis auriculariae]
MPGGPGWPGSARLVRGPARHSPGPRPFPRPGPSPRGLLPENKAQSPACRTSLPIAKRIWMTSVLLRLLRFPLSAGQSRMLCCPPPVGPDTALDDSPIVEQVIGKAADVPPGSKKMFEVNERKILVINDSGRLFAINGLCSHYNFPLDGGAYSKGRIRCPLHGACFNVATGDIEDYPGFDSLHTFNVSDKNGDLVIKTTEKRLSNDRRTRTMPTLKKCEDIPIVVIGSGPAAATFIEHSRLNGLATPILVISEESFTPYDRVLCSKKPSAGGKDIALRDDAYYAERRVKFLLETSVTGVDTNGRQLKLSNGEKQIYSKLVIATGGNVRKLTVPGADLKNVHYLRKVQEGNAIAEGTTGKNVVCIGASFIGMEIASSIKDQAASVTVIATGEEPLPVFGPEVGRGIRKKFEERGVKFYTNAKVVALKGSGDAVSHVVLSSGEEVPAEVVVVGIGVTPATEFLKGSKIEINKQGYIPVDKHFRTNVDYVYAIGDVVSFPLPLWNVESLNIQHFQTAQAHGQNLGYSIVGKPQPGPIVPYFWSLFFFAFGLKFSGCSVGSDATITHGDTDGDFVKYYLKNDKVVAVASAGPSIACPEFSELFKRGIAITKADVEKNTKDEWANYLD